MLRRFVVLGAAVVVCFGLGVGCKSSPEEKPAGAAENTAGAVTYRCAYSCGTTEHVHEGEAVPQCCSADMVPAE